MKTNKVYHLNCLDLIQTIKKEDINIDLIVTDPPYEINNTNTGGNSDLSMSIQKMNDELQKHDNITKGITIEYLEAMYSIQKNTNIYIWCNHKQIPFYLDFFVTKHNCKFDILIWNKTNATPLFNNKYLTDKEYCLYFRQNGYCKPHNYNDAKTIFTQPINVIDKKHFKHPTIKPLDIITTLIKNSSKEGDMILDPFMGSGTTGVACKSLNRNFIGAEIYEKYANISNDRILKTIRGSSLLKTKNKEISQKLF